MKITTLQYIAELYQYVISIYIIQPQYVYVFYAHIMFWYIRIMIFSMHIRRSTACRTVALSSVGVVHLCPWLNVLNQIKCGFQKLESQIHFFFAIQRSPDCQTYILCMAFSGNHMNTSISSVHAQEKSDIDRKRYRLWRGPHLQHISLPYQNTCVRFDFIALFGTFKSYFCRWFDHFRKQSMRHFIWVRDLSAVFDGVDP